MKAILIILQSQKNPLITLDKLRTLLIFLLLLLSCDFNYESNDNIVARAGEKTLTNEELIEKLPKIINSEDSLIISNKIINDWALNQLLIKNAEINLGRFYGRALPSRRDAQRKPPDLRHWQLEHGPHELLHLPGLHDWHDGVLVDHVVVLVRHVPTHASSSATLLRAQVHGLGQNRGRRLLIAF